MFAVALGAVLIAVHSLLPVGVVGLGALALLVGVLWTLGNFAAGTPRALLRRLGAEAPEEGATEQLTSLLEGLCVENGLRVPEVRLLRDSAENAIVLGWSAEDATLVLTTGLLERCGVIELEGVLAHELAHIKRGDLRDAAFAALGCGALALCSSSAAQLMDRLLITSREAEADLGAAAMTRYPPGLMHALQTIMSSPTRPVGLGRVVVRLTAASWLVNLEEARPRRTRPGNLELSERVALLAEL
jgi:Zn-dependent protease with chaperone function